MLGYRQSITLSSVGLRIECAAIYPAAYEYLSLSCMIGGRNYAFLFHAFNKRGCFVIADGKPTLNVTSRTFSVAQDNSYCTVIKISRLLSIHAAGADRKSTRLNSSHIPLSRMPSSA